MKKLLLIMLSVVLLTGCTQMNVSSEINSENDKLDILTLFTSETNSQNKAWVGTFQLVFNDMKNNILKKDIYFKEEKPTSDLIGLNNEEFNSTMLNESSYYTSYGEVSPEAKINIEKGIWDKFKEKSDILDKADWSKKDGKYYAYAMLKKQFEFLKEFDILEKASFNNSKEQYNFFGITDKSEKYLDKNVNVLFYNNENEYAIQLLTKTNDIVYLYRTDNNNNFKKQYEKMLADSEKYQGDKYFTTLDTLKVPNLKMNVLHEYPELCHKIIEGTKNLYFSNAVETIQLELDNKGGKVKSEGLLMVEKMSLLPEAQNPRHFNFDKTFTMFLIDSGKKNPYLALRVNDLSMFQK